MKKFLCLIVCLILPLAALADDAFLDDFNDYAQYMYGIQPASCDDPDAMPLFFTTGETTVFHYSDHDVIIGEDHMEAISAACCVFRCVDNSGSMIDQYGRILHAYFMARSAGGEKRATTESSISIYVSIDSGILTIRLVR